MNTPRDHLIVSAIMLVISVGVIAYSGHVINKKNEAISSALETCRAVKNMNLDKLVGAMYAQETGEYLDYNLVCKPLEDALYG